MTAPSLQVPRGKFVVIVGILFTAVTVVGVCWALQYLLAMELLLLGLLGVALVAPVIMTRDLRLDLVAPAVICCATYLIYLVLSPAYDLFTGQTWFLGRDLGSMYIKGACYSLLVVICFWLGYFLPAGRRLGQAIAVPNIPERFGRGYALILLVSAVTGLVLWTWLTGTPIKGFFLPGIITPVDSLVSSPSEGGYNYLFSMVELLVPGLLLAWRFGWRKLWVLTVALLSAIIYTSIGFRYRLIVLGLGTVILYSKYLRKRIRLWHVGLVILLASIMLVWVGANRGQIRAAGVGTVSGVTTALPTGEEFFSELFYNAKILPTFLAVVDAVPSRIDFDYGATLSFTVVRIIPREIWPSKPAPPFQAIITESFGTHEAALAGAAYPNFGEYYIAFGIPSLILGMVFFGLGVRTLHEWFQAHPDNPNVQVVYAISTALLIQIISRGYTAQMVHHWAFLVLPVLLVGPLYRFIKRVA